ncbi:hypothetical protein DC3_52560 [Deinococcus cellulosilyticus NBRC 106333 = KACC 11606]|uniref:Uncharacterized protein n=1 Tax=Deinococcus cellulosilyticus (strain DSM 18568 / NBRC 106333 / KACC 11606 / 5516J-15) TaxID=1223518 RepID=A0A511NB58_DEIC1|nr:hypothetical protein DC3_52560 [Deinococcus cellulosilyticus NBRC 106333 = KACC 11606]
MPIRSQVFGQATDALHLFDLVLSGNQQGFIARRAKGSRVTDSCRLTGENDNIQLRYIEFVHFAAPKHHGTAQPCARKRLPNAKRKTPSSQLVLRVQLVQVGFKERT